MAPQWPRNVRGNQNACPTMNKAEMANLEFFRASRGQSNAKAGDQSNGKGAQMAFICKWGDCKAGCNQTATHGQTLCIGCKRYKGLALAPPLHKMSERAFNLACGRSNVVPKDNGKGKSKGKGKGKAYDNHIQNSTDLTEAERQLKASRVAMLKNATKQGPAEEVIGHVAQAESEDVEMGEQEEKAQTLADSLLTMCMYPAPMIADLKPYPRPMPRVTAQEKVSEATEQLAKLENGLQDAKKAGQSAAILKAYSQEIAAIKEAQPKTAKLGQSKGVLLTQLQRRLEMADKLEQNALDRHKKHLEALDWQSQQISAIRKCKVEDFEEAKKAFAARLIEDKQKFIELMLELGTLVKEVQQPAEALTDLNRTFNVKLEDLPSLTEEPNSTYLEELASLHFFYSNAGDFCRVPPTTFEQMEVSTGTVHTMIGDQAWEGYWGKENAKNIAKAQYLPSTMHDVLRHLLRPKREQLSAMAGMEPAKVRYEAAKTLEDRVVLGYAAY